MVAVGLVSASRGPAISIAVAPSHYRSDRFGWRKRVGWPDASSFFELGEAEGEGRGHLDSGAIGGDFEVPEVFRPSFGGGKL